MGTQILGVSSDPMAAKILADIFLKYQPYWVKKTEAVYGSLDGAPIQVDTRTIEFTPEEQILLRSYLFRDQRTFEFYVRSAPGEGNIKGDLRRINIGNFDKGIYPDAHIVPLVRKKLSLRDGIEIGKILREIDDRKQQHHYFPGQIETRREKDISIWD